MFSGHFQSAEHGRAGNGNALVYTLHSLAAHYALAFDGKDQWKL